MVPPAPRPIPNVINLTDLKYQVNVIQFNKYLLEAQNVIRITGNTEELYGLLNDTTAGFKTKKNKDLYGLDPTLKKAYNLFGKRLKDMLKIQRRTSVFTLAST